MKIEKLKIENWRSIKFLEIDAQRLMVIIGQNNHGKSNLLSAILFFFGEVRHQDLDFNNGSSELYVEVEFSELDDSDKTTFKKYLTSDNHILVRKSAYLGGNFEYKGYIENPEYEWLQESNASAYTKRELAESLPFKQYIPTSGRITKQDIIDAQVAYIDQNRQSIKFNFEQEETNFLGLKSVAKGIFGQVYFIPAVKEASDDFSSKESSVFGKMYTDIISLMSENNGEWKETREKLGKLFGSLNKIDCDGNENTTRPKQLVDFEEELSCELTAWRAQIEIEVSPPDIDSVFRANTQVWVDDGVRTDIRRKGHGLQRALIVALIQVLSKRTKNLEAENAAESSSRKASDSRFFLFEEPELYLHPQAQRSLFNSFIELSDAGSQVILCTHSSGLIDVERYKSIYIVTKTDETVGTKLKRCNVDLFTGDAKKDFNLSYWVNPDRGELFFATKVILVEGPTDKTIIPLLAKHLGIYRYDYTLIDCGSKSNIPLYMRLLNRFEIPYVAVYDRDHQVGKDQQALDVADKDTKFIEDEINTCLGSSVVLYNDIEEELGMQPGNRNKPFVALSYVTDPSFMLSTDFETKIRYIFDNAIPQQVTN